MTFSSSLPTSLHELLNALAVVRARPCRRCPARRRRRCPRRGTVPDSGRRCRRCRLGASVSRCRTWTFLSWPSATNRKPLLRRRSRTRRPRPSPATMTTPNWPVTTAPSVFFETIAFLHELAVLLEHLDAVAAPVADVDHAVLGDLDAGHVAERLGRRIVRRVGCGRRAGGASRRTRTSAACRCRCPRRTRRCGGCRCRRRTLRWPRRRTRPRPDGSACVWLSGPSILPGVPICSRNLPSRENFSTCASAGPAGAPRPRPAAAGAAAAPRRPRRRRAREPA